MGAVQDVARKIANISNIKSPKGDFLWSKYARINDSN